MFYLWVAAQIPYTHDDWDWGLEQGIQQLTTASINSRYMGNLLVVIMTRSEVLKTMIIGGCSFLVPYLMSCYAVKECPHGSKGKQVLVFVVCNFLLLTMRTYIWQQTYGWVSGFANFVISAVFLFIWVNQIQCVFAAYSTPPGKKWNQILFSFMMSILGQLFLENIAIYTVMLATFICIVYFVRYRKIPAEPLLMIIGSVIGLMILFSSPIYAALWSTGSAVDGNRTLLFFRDFMMTVKRIVIQAGTLAVKGYVRNWFLCLSVMILLAWLIRQNQEMNIKEKRMLVTTNLILALCIFVVGQYDVWGQRTHLLNIIDLFITVVFFAAATIETIRIFRKEPHFMAKVLTIWFSVPMILAPLMVTNESGGRLYYTSCVFLVLYEAFLLIRILEKSDGITLRKMSGWTVIVMIPVVFWFGMVYHNIGSVRQERDAVIDAAVQSETAAATIPSFPYQQYLWFPNPASEERVQYFKEFYGIPENMELIFEKE